MLTRETQKLISNLLETVAENERAVEEVRQVLAEQENFDPLALFNKLCNGNNGISREELSYFLEDYSVRHLSREIDQLFFTYNRSRETMGYTSFLKMILPSSSHFLRQLKVELIPHRRKIIEVTSEIEWRLIRILEKELQLYRSVEQQKEQLSKRWDFKVSSAFRCISLSQTNSEIEHGDLLNFIESMNGSTSSDDILNILRRCDHDRDGKIGVLDLEISLTPFKRSKQIYFNQALQLQESKRESCSISQGKSSTKKRSYPMDQFKENADISFQEEKYAKVRSHSQHAKNHQKREEYHIKQEKIYSDHPISQPNKKYENYYSVNVTPTKGEQGQDWDTQKSHNKSEIFNSTNQYYNPVGRQNKQKEEDKSTVDNLRNSLSKQRTNSFQQQQRNSEEINASKKRETLLQKYYRQEPQQDCFSNYKQELKQQINSEIKDKIQDINHSTYLRNKQLEFNNSSKLQKEKDYVHSYELKEGIRQQIKSELKEKDLEKINQSYKRDLSYELNKAIPIQKTEGLFREPQHKEDIKNPINNVTQERFQGIRQQNVCRDLSSELENPMKVQKSEELVKRQKQKEEISNQIQNEIKERAIYSLNNSYKNDLSFESGYSKKIKKVEEQHYESDNKSEIKQQIQKTINEKIEVKINQNQEKDSSSEFINPVKLKTAEIPLPQPPDEQKLKNKEIKYSEDISSLKQQSDNFSQYPSKQIVLPQQLPNQQEHITLLLSKMISVLRDIESLKESLSMRADFNLRDAFKAFDLDSQDILRPNHFQNLLSKAKVEFSNDQVQCFVSRISPNSILKIEDIEALFRPLSQEYRNLLENRISFFDGDTFKYDSFSPETKQLIASLLRESISGEYQLERLKRELSQQKNFSLEKLFEIFEDKRQNGYITYESLKKAIGQFKLFVADADIKNIMKRLNSNDNGKVSFENYALYILPIKIALY